MNSKIRRFRARLREGISRRLQPLAARHWKNLCNPASVMHKLTLRCNARCAHCDIWKREFPSEELTTAEVKRMYDQLREWLGPYNLVITGGEALLRPDAAEVASYAARLGFVVEFLSNGYILEDAAESLARSGVDKVTVSFDGSKPNTLNLMRGLDGFSDRVSAGVQKLVLSRNSCNPEMRIWLKTVVNRHNIDQLSVIAQLAKTWGVQVFYQPIEQNYAQKYDPKWYLKSDLWPIDAKAAAHAIDELVKLKRAGFPIANVESNLLVMRDYFRDPQVWMRKVREHIAEEKAPICLSGVSYFEIQPDGKVKICGEGGEIGDCRQQPPGEIWRNRGACWLEGCSVHQ